ncbi:MAG: hypothetical protein WB660_16700 [Candidatus Sulfotelmatobacter sp.]
MTETTLKRKGGRPPLPPPPQNAGEVRALISVETVKTKPRELTLRHLYRLLRVFVAAEDAQRAEERNRLLAEANRLAAETRAVKKDDYRCRREIGE